MEERGETCNYVRVEHGEGKKKMSGAGKKTGGRCVSVVGESSQKWNILPRRRKGKEESTNYARPEEETKEEPSGLLMERKKPHWRKKGKPRKISRFRTEK